MIKHKTQFAMLGKTIYITRCNNFFKELKLSIIAFKKSLLNRMKNDSLPRFVVLNEANYLTGLIGQRGTALLMTIMLLNSILIVALGASSLVNAGVLIGRAQGRSVVSFFAAEAGSERVLWEIRKNNSSLEECDTNVSAPNYKIVDFSEDPAICSDSVIPPSGPFLNLLAPPIQYYVKIATTSPNMKIQSIGSYLKVNRTVELMYAR
jgi:hypothetical protein